MDIVGKLHNASILDRLGFQTDHFMTADEAAGGGWLELAQRNLMAHEFGTFVVALLRNRLRRNLFLLGSWPVRACLFASDSLPVRQSALNEFKDKHKRYLRLKATGNHHLQRFMKASMFETTPCIQLVAMLDGSDWELTDAIIQHAGQQSKRLVTSQICEDGFNRCKAAALKGINHEISNTRVFYTLLHKQVMDVVHDYKAPDIGCHAPPRGTSLPENVWKGPVWEAWADLKKVRGTSAPAWYAPGAHNFWEHVSHDVLMDFCEKEGCLNKVKDTWKCCLVQSMTLVVRHTTHKAWFFVLGQASSETVFGWPAQCHEHGEGGKIHFTLGSCSNIEEIPFLCVLDEESWEGYFFEWLAPASQVAQHNLSMSCVRAFPVWPQGEPKPILQVAASQAFFQLPRTSRTKVAKDICRLEVPKASSIFELIWMMVQGVLQSSDAETLAIAQLRCCHQRGQDACQKELYESNECEDLMEQYDKDDLKKARDKAIALEEEVASFKEAYRQKKDQVAPPGPAAKRAARGRPMKGAAASSTAHEFVPRPFPTDARSIEQQEAKLFLPPNSFIWRSWRIASWIGRYPPYGTHQATMLGTSCEGALKEVLKAVWMDWLKDHNLDTSACTVEGLF